MVLSAADDPSSKKLGSFLVMSQFQGSVNSSAMFLTAAAQNLLCMKLAVELGVNIASPWVTWFTAAVVPALIGLAITPAILYKVRIPLSVYLDVVVPSTLYHVCSATHKLYLVQSRCAQILPISCSAEPRMPEVMIVCMSVTCTCCLHHLLPGACAWSFQGASKWADAWVKSTRRMFLSDSLIMPCCWLYIGLC